MKKFFAAVCCCCLMAMNVVAQDAEAPSAVAGETVVLAVQDDAQGSVSDQVVAPPEANGQSVVDDEGVHSYGEVLGDGCGCAPVVNPCCPPVNCCPAPRTFQRPMILRSLRARMGSRGCCC